jgi:hypothetical protein
MNRLDYAPVKMVGEGSIADMPNAPLGKVGSLLGISSMPNMPGLSTINTLSTTSSGLLGLAEIKPLSFSNDYLPKTQNTLGLPTINTLSTTSGSLLDSTRIRTVPYFSDYLRKIPNVFESVIRASSFDSGIKSVQHKYDVSLDYLVELVKDLLSVALKELIGKKEYKSQPESLNDDTLTGKKVKKNLMEASKKGVEATKKKAIKKWKPILSEALKIASEKPRAYSASHLARILNMRLNLGYKICTIRKQLSREDRIKALLKNV